MSESSIKPGDTVDIIAGPFSGGRALVQSVDRDKGKVHLQMLVLGEAAPFTVSSEQVRVAKAHRAG